MTDSSKHRRRIDRVLDPEFTASLGDIAVEELRDRREMLDELDTELSYYRRMLHGKLDLLDFEIRRRNGEEERSLIEALPEILADPPSARTSNPLDRELSLDLPDLAGEGRRSVDQALSDDFLSKLPFLDDDELPAIRNSLSSTEQTVSEQRRAVHDAHDAVTGELTNRYRDGVADADDLLTPS